MDEQLTALWEYYRAMAELLGRQADEETGEDTQAAYSLLWFFEESLEQKVQAEGTDRTLLLAFLGDMEARNELRQRFQQAALPNLGDFSWPYRAPNDSQIAAIRAALVYPVSFIQGPPGTGKTATILNLLSYIKEQGDLTAAVVSSNSEATRNIIEKLEDYGLENSVAALGSKRVRQEFWNAHVPENRATTLGGRADPVANMSFAEFQEAFHCPIVTSTLHSLQRCFRNGESYQYDYVIIDEASQVSVLQGLIALASAKHLVIVGDEKQLSAFISMQLEELNAPAQRIPPLYRITDSSEQEGQSKDESNFLSLALRAFLGIDDDGRALPGFAAPLPGGSKSPAKTFLAQHYRCHPGVIEFCNRSFYNGNLRIKTKGEGLPIRVLWYDGDYCESERNPDNRPVNHYNRKQIELFVRDEWPRLQQHIPELQARLGDEPLKICILSPYRRELELLLEALNDAQQGQDDPLHLELAEEGGNEAGDGRLAMLTTSTSTIHQAQGKEFHIVYLLPTEDAANWEWPWSQGERLINVAVSRAKWELCIITSSLLMSEEARAALGCGVPLAPHQRAQEGENRRLCIQRLLDYAVEHGGDNFLHAPDDSFYGFHKTSRVSIFDNGYKIKDFATALAGRATRMSGVLRARQSFWAPQRTVERVLWQLCTRRDLLLYKEVRMRAFLNENNSPVITRERVAALFPEDPEAEPGTQTHVENSIGLFRLDFVVCDRENHPLLIVEADGAHHRGDEYNHINDEHKNRILREILGGLVSFLRLSSDGSSYLETDGLRSRCAAGCSEAVLRQAGPTIEAQLDLAQARTPHITMDASLLRGCRAGEANAVMPNDLFYDWIIWETLWELEHDSKLPDATRNLLRHPKPFRALLRGSVEEFYGDVIAVAEQADAFGALPLSDEVLKQRIRSMFGRQLIHTDQSPGGDPKAYVAARDFPRNGGYCYLRNRNQRVQQEAET